MRRIDLACRLTETVAELVSSRFAFKATGPAPQLQLLFSRSPGTLSPMAAVLNAQLTAMLTALDGAAAGLGNEFVAHVGSTMAMAAAMPADWFPGPPRACPGGKVGRIRTAVRERPTLISIRSGVESGAGTSFYPDRGR